MSIKKKRSIFDIMDEYFEDLEEWAEELEKRFGEKPSWNQKTCTIEPLRDITITSTEVIVTVDLPYTQEKNVKVTPLDKNTLEIKAEMKKKIKFDDFGITHHKGEFHTLQCRTRVPVPVYIHKMKISFKKGVLEIRLPRKDEHEIPVE